MISSRSQVVVDIAIEGPVGGDKRLQEIQREIVRGDRFEDASGVGAVKIEITRSVATQINPSE